MTSSRILLTGATSGIGLELARQLLAEPARRLIVGARRPAAATRLRALAGTERLTILPLDLASLASTRAFADAVVAELAGARLDALAANAGVQLPGPLRLTADGYEETFQANLLSHGMLIDRLMAHLASHAPVVITASGSHDPDEPGARLIGFRGGLFVGAERVARGDLDPTASLRQQGFDWYATSKLCTILLVYALARRAAPEGPRFIAFDPGLAAQIGFEPVAAGGTVNAGHAQNHRRKARFRGGQQEVFRGHQYLAGFPGGFGGILFGHHGSVILAVNTGAAGVDEFLGR